MMPVSLAKGVVCIVGQIIVLGAGGPPGEVVGIPGGTNHPASGHAEIAEKIVESCGSNHGSDSQVSCRSAINH